MIIKKMKNKMKKSKCCNNSLIKNNKWQKHLINSNLNLVKILQDL